MVCNICSGFRLYLGEITEQNWVGVPQPGHERGVGHQFLVVECVAWSTELVNGLTETGGLSITLKHQKRQRESNKTASKRSENNCFIIALHNCPCGMEIPQFPPSSLPVKPLPRVKA